MRAANSSLSGLFENLLDRHWHFEGGEPVDDPDVACATTTLESAELVLERTRARVQPEHNQMHAATVVIEREFGSRDQFKPTAGSGLGCRRNAFLSVMVGQREGDETFGEGECNQLFGIGRTVGSG